MFAGCLGNTDNLCWRRRPCSPKKRQQVLRAKERESHSNLEVVRDHVDIGPELGNGNFGTVYKGTLKVQVNQSLQG